MCELVFNLFELISVHIDFRIPETFFNLGSPVSQCEIELVSWGEHGRIFDSEYRIGILLDPLGIEAGVIEHNIDEEYNALLLEFK